MTYANMNSIPFLDKNGGHGWIKGLGELKGGIQITLAKMNDITVHNNTATVQGGARTYMVRDALWKLQKQTSKQIARLPSFNPLIFPATGACECTGFLGPALGGGHGLTQGLHGLAIDNFVSARVLLGNGTLINVSATEHEDLWWGLRGAGVNFGVVTEVDYKVYDVPKGEDMWYYEVWDFSPKDIVEIYEQHNVFLDNMPAQAVLFTMWYRNPSIDQTSVSARYDAHDIFQC